MQACLRAIPNAISSRFSKMARSCVLRERILLHGWTHASELAGCQVGKRASLQVGCCETRVFQKACIFVHGCERLQRRSLATDAHDDGRVLHCRLAYVGDALDKLRDTRVLVFLQMDERDVDGEIV